MKLNSFDRKTTTIIDLVDKLQNGGRHIPFGRKRQGCKQIETDECPKVWWTSYQNKKKLFSYMSN